MTIIPAFTAVRLIPRESGFLDRKSGSRGEIFFDKDSSSLRIYDGSQSGGITLARSDLANISEATFLSKAEISGITSSVIPTSSESPENPVNGKFWFDVDSNILYVYYDDGTGGEWIQPEASIGEIDFTESNGFSSIAVTGQDIISASTITDTFNLVAGSNVSITTDSNSKSITISATALEGTTSNSFETIAVADQNSLIASTSTDILTIAAGSGISISTDNSTDTLTIASTVISGVTDFADLIDADLASLTVDKIYLPAITMLVVTNSGATAYRFDQYGTTNNPTIYAINGTTIAFDLQAQGHPFLIQTGLGVNYNTGLIHVANDGTVSTGASAQGKDSGTLYWKIPADISGGYRYQCQTHAPMVGSISIKNFGSI